MSVVPLGVVGLALIVAGCGAGAASPAPAQPRRAAAPAEPGRIGRYELPAWPAALNQSSKHVREGIALTREFMALPASRPAAGVDQEGYKAWMTGDFSAWMQRGAQALETAQTRLNALAKGSAAERVVASALVALMYEHWVEQFVSVPTPPVLRTDAELVQIFLDGLRQAAVPWVDKAANAYRYCARAAAADPSLERWQRLCAEHERTNLEWLARVPKPSPAPPPSAAEVQPARPPGSEVCWQPEAPPLAAAARPPAEQAGSAPRLAAIFLGHGVPLLAEERRVLAAALQTDLQRRWQDLKVGWIAGAALQRLRTDWASGRLSAGGQRCARVAPFSESVEHRTPWLLGVYADLVCTAGDDRCELKVSIHGDSVPEGIGRDLRAPLASSLADLSTWIRAVAELQPAEPLAGIFGILKEQRWHPPPGADLAFVELARHGAWQPGEPDAQLEQARRDLLACREHASYAYPLPVVLAIGARGTVDEVWQDDAPRVLAAQQRCVERVLRRMRFAPAAGARRLATVVAFGTGSGDVRDQRFGPRVPESGVRVSIGSNAASTVWPGHLIEYPLQLRLARCMAQHARGERETLELAAELEVDAAGKPTAASVDASPASKAALSPALRACLRAALQSAAFECTADSQPTRVSAAICLRFEDGSAAQ